MTTYIIKRLLLIPVMLIGITLVSFCVIIISPGTGGAQGSGDLSTGRLTAQQARVLKETFHADEHVAMRYLYWLGALQPPYQPSDLALTLPVMIDPSAAPGERTLPLKLTFQGKIQKGDVNAWLARKKAMDAGEKLAGPGTSVTPTWVAHTDENGVYPVAEIPLELKLTVLPASQPAEELPQNFVPNYPSAERVSDTYPFRYAATLDRAAAAPGQTVHVLVRLSSSDIGHLYMEGDHPPRIGVEAEAPGLVLEDAYAPPAKWRGLIFGDFGRSVTRPSVTVYEKLAEALPVTLCINLIVLFIVYTTSIPIGIYSATHHNSVPDRIMTVILFILYSLPSFWVAILLIKLVVSVPPEYRVPFQGIWPAGAENLPTWKLLVEMTKHLFLPVVVLSLGAQAFLSRFMRVGMIDIIRQDYIRTARAKGCSEPRVVYKHALRNSLIPMVTIIAGMLPGLIGGSVIIEQIFGIPGMGLLGYVAVLERDYTTLMATLTISAFLTLLGILVSDMLYVVVDPRISFEGKS